MKVVDTLTLKKMLAHARELQLNRLLPKTTEKQLDPNGFHVLSKPMIHNDACDYVRCLVVMLKMNGTNNPREGQLDFEIHDYNQIPEHKEVPA